MSRYAHKTKSQRKLITLQEWAGYCGLSRLTIATYLKQYLQIGGDYDPRDIYSVLGFFRFLQRRAKGRLRQGF